MSDRFAAPSEWARVRELFDRAAELPAAERDAFLDAECGEDAPLRREVASLLEQDGRTGDPAREVIDRSASAALGPVSVGSEIGPWRLVEKLGEGGMGEVFLARRSDGAYESDVALKVVRAGRLSPELVRRFLAERGILARLEHPNIARLLDGGSLETTDGTVLPWFAMERVEGSPIDAFCDARSLPVDSRIRLFLEVGAAVSRAHRSLVVHRDLKPDNILVTRDGIPKLLDFGVAKLLDPEGDERVGLETSAGSHLLTPEYASPEQIRGEPVTTASDVFSLGVVLYELLAGRRPHESRTGRVRDLEQAVLETDAERPSRAATGGDPEARAEIARRRGTTPAALRRDLAGDLDAILSRALRKEPTERYPSVDDFTADLRRHLDGLPVSAVDGDLRYRAVKFARRHRFRVAAGAAILVSLVAGLVTASVGLVAARRANRALVAQREETLRESAKVAAVNAFLEGMLGAADIRQKGRDVRVVELLVPAEERLERSGADPAVRVSLHRTLGRVFSSLGESDRAEKAVSKGLVLARTALGPKAAETLELETLHLDVLIDAERFPEAEGEARRLVAEKSRGAGPDDPALLSAIAALGDVLCRQGRFADGIPTLRRALAGQERALGPLASGTLRTIHRIGRALVYDGCSGEALDLFREESVRRVKVAGPADREAQTAILWQSVALENEGRVEEAGELRRRIVEIDNAAGAPPASLAAALNNYGVILEARERFAEAAAIYSDALALSRVAAGPEHPQTLTLEYNAGDAARAAGDLSAALSAHRHVAEARARVLGPNHSLTIFATVRVADLLAELGRFEESGKWHDLAAARVREAGSNVLPWLPDYLRAFRGLRELRAGRKREGLALVDPAIAALVAAEGPESMNAREIVRIRERLVGK